MEIKIQRRTDIDKVARVRGRAGRPENIERKKIDILEKGIG